MGVRPRDGRPPISPLAACSRRLSRRRGSTRRKTLSHFPKAAPTRSRKSRPHWRYCLSFTGLPRRVHLRRHLLRAPLSKTHNIVFWKISYIAGKHMGGARKALIKLEAWGKAWGWILALPAMLISLGSLWVSCSTNYIQKSTDRPLLGTMGLQVVSP